MAKVNSTGINSQDDFDKLIKDIKSKVKKGSKYELVLGSLSDLDLNTIGDFIELVTIHRLKVTIVLYGSVNICSACLLNPSFIRIGFSNRTIDLSIPSGITRVKSDSIIDLIKNYSIEGSEAKVETHIKNGDIITMNDAKELGLVKRVVDVKNAGKKKNVSGVVKNPDTDKKDVASKSDNTDASDNKQES